MPNQNATTATDTTTAVHGELTCADVEALLAEAITANAELRAENAGMLAINADIQAENAELVRLLDLARTGKRQAIDEAVMLRSRPIA